MRDERVLVMGPSSGSLRGHLIPEDLLGQAFLTTSFLGSLSPLAPLAAILVPLLVSTKNRDLWEGPTPE